VLRCGLYIPDQALFEVVVPRVEDLYGSFVYRQYAAAGPQTLRRMPSWGFTSGLRGVTLAACFIGSSSFLRALLRIRRRTRQSP
jgi:hypothetical protein